MPETWCGPRKFHGNSGWSNLGPLHGDHAALNIFSAAWILHQEPLLGHHHARQGHQRAMRIDHKRLRTFIKLRAFPRGSINDNGNA